MCAVDHKHIDMYVYLPTTKKKKERQEKALKQGHNVPTTKKKKARQRRQSTHRAFPRAQIQRKKKSKDEGKAPLFFFFLSAAVSNSLVVVCRGLLAADIRFRISRLPEVAGEEVRPAPTNIQLVLRPLPLQLLVFDRVVRVVEVELPKEEVGRHGPLAHLRHTRSLAKRRVECPVERNGEADGVGKYEVILRVFHFSEGLTPPAGVDRDGEECRRAGVAVLARHTGVTTRHTAHHAIATSLHRPAMPLAGMKEKKKREVLCPVYQLIKRGAAAICESSLNNSPSLFSFLMVL